MPQRQPAIEIGQRPELVAPLLRHPPHSRVSPGQEQLLTTILVGVDGGRHTGLSRFFLVRRRSVPPDPSRQQASRRVLCCRDRLRTNCPTGIPPAAPLV